MWSAVCDLFNPPKKKVFMRSTAWAIYKTTFGHTGKCRVVTNVFDASNQYTLVAEIFNDIVNKLYKQGELICELRLVSEKEFLETEIE